MEHYEIALRLIPDCIEAHNNLGLALVKTGRFQEGIEQYRQALHLKPDSMNDLEQFGIGLCRHAAIFRGHCRSPEGLGTCQSQGQTETAKQIEDWLNAYRVKLSKRPECNSVQ